MARRFSRLKYALTTLRTPNSNAPTPDAPANTIARNFQDFASGKTKLVYSRDDNSNPGEILKTGILPFFFGGNPANGAIVALSKRADEKATLDSVQSACNHVTYDPESQTKIQGFKPAQVTVFDYGTGSASPTSQITGIKYSKRIGNSFTFPYGASATEKAENKVRGDILIAVEALTTASASFHSEKY